MHQASDKIKYAFVLCFFIASFLLMPFTAVADGKSVYRLNPVIDGLALTVGTLGMIIPYALSSRIIKPRCPCDPLEVNKFDRSALYSHNDVLDVISDISQGASMLLPPIIDLADVGPKKAFVEDLVVFGEALAINGAIVTAVKHIVQRPLPRVYSGHAPALVTSPGGYRAFYSGHASSTFAALSAAAVTGNLRHNLGPWPWVATAVIGTSVALERVAAGRHFYTDVIVGSLAGLTIGTLIPLLHKRSSTTGQESLGILGSRIEFLRMGWRF